MLDHMLEWYDLTDEERRIRDLAREVAREQIAPHAERHDREGTFVRESIDALSEAGLLGVGISKEYGGMGGTPLAATMALEAVSAACGSTGASYLFHLNLCHMINGAGPEELRRKYLPQLAKDKLGGFAINERARLFRGAFETRIEDKGDHWLLNGFKRFSTSAGQSDVTIVQGQLPGTEQTANPVVGQLFVLVEKDTPGFSATPVYPMALRGASNGSWTLEDVKVPKENLLGEQPEPMIRAVVIKGNSVLGPNVPAMGCAGAALEAAVSHVRERGAEEWMSHALAPLSQTLNAFRAYSYYCARIVPRMEEGTFHEGMALAHVELPLMGGLSCPAICDQVMEIMGGRSFMLNSPIQRCYRDARAFAYLGFPMDERRLKTAEILYVNDALASEPRTMPWDQFAEYAHRMGTAATMEAPEEVRAKLSRGKIEEYARARGADEVTLGLAVEYRRQAAAFGPPPGAGDGAPGTARRQEPPRGAPSAAAPEQM